MMRREAPVHLGVEQDMAAGQSLRQRLDQRTHGPVAAIPHYGEAPTAYLRLQPREVRLRHRQLHRRTARGRRGRRCHERAQHLAVHRLRADHELETVLLAWIVRAGHHDAAIETVSFQREMQLRCRPQSDAMHQHTPRDEPFDQSALQIQATTLSHPCRPRCAAARARAPRLHRQARVAGRRRRPAVARRRHAGRRSGLPRDLCALPLIP